MFHRQFPTFFAFYSPNTTARDFRENSLSSQPPLLPIFKPKRKLFCNGLPLIFEGKMLTN